MNYLRGRVTRSPDAVCVRKANERKPRMRNTPVVIWLMVIAVLAAAWALPGCRPAAERSAEEHAPLAEEDLATRAPEVEAEAEPEAEGEAEAPPAAEDIGDEETIERLSPEQAEAVLDVEVDLDRAYLDRDFRPLSTVMRIGTEEQKARARRILERLLLSSRVAGTRAAAAAVLMADAAGSEAPLTQAALRDPESQVRRQAIEALSKAPYSPELVSALRSAQEAEDPEVRVAALMAEMGIRLNEMQPGDDTAWVARLLARRRDDASAQMQMSLVQRGATALPIAIDVLQTAGDENARAGAACVIGLICAGTSPKQQEFAALSRAIMKAGLEEPQPANLDGLKPLENALASDSSWKVRATAAQGLGYLGQESSAPLLGRALEDEYEEVRWWAALALETVPAEEALDDLAHAANRDPSERVRAAAVRALGWVESEGAVMPLIRATADASSVVRQAAAEELARFRSPASLQALVRLFADPSEDVRWAAVVAAGELRDEETVPALLQAMRDPSPMVSNAAERALQRMGRAEQRFGLESEL